MSGSAVLAVRLNWSNMQLWQEKLQSFSVYIHIRVFFKEHFRLLKNYGEKVKSLYSKAVMTLKVLNVIFYPVTTK